MELTKLFPISFPTGLPDKPNTHPDIENHSIAGQPGEFAIGTATMQRGIHQPIV